MPYIKLESGSSYNLTDLFSGNKRIIIPDMQREYCWSEKRHGLQNNEELVTSFIESLKNTANDEKIQLGIIYGYEDPSNFVHLCDGQQRLTTLYLLVGMLYRIAKKSMAKENMTLKRILISEFEEKDDFEPRLQYSIRESTLYFLRDMVKSYFLECAAYKVKDIDKQDWYYADYNQDPTIRNMIEAMDLIEKAINGQESQDQFIEFITTKLELFYFDMQDRKHGEEQFVVINTTGKPLTLSENLKPYLLSPLISEQESDKYSDIWEEWETWFWRNRRDSEYESDKGMQRFFEWYLRIQYKIDEVSIDKLKCDQTQRLIEQIEDMNKYMEALKTLSAYLNDTKSRIRKLLLSIDNRFKSDQIRLIFRNMTISGSCQLQNLLLPLLSFMVRISQDEKDIYDVLRRLRRNYFSKDGRFNERSKEYVDWRNILKIIEQVDSKDSFLLYDTADLGCEGCWNPPSEEIKRQFSDAQKQEMEEWEDHPDFQGDLFYILTMHELHSDSESIPELSSEQDYDFQTLKRCYSNYARLAGLYTKSDDLKNNILFNNYRLFRFIIGCIKVQHIYNQSYIYEGCKFSEYNRKHLLKLDFLKLCASEDIDIVLSDYLKHYFKRGKGVFSINSDSSTFEVVQSWLCLKVLAANELGRKISVHDHNIAAYIHDDNRIFKNKEFNIYNVICGYTTRGYLWYANREVWQAKEESCLHGIGESFQVRESGFSEDFRNSPNNEELYQKHKQWVDHLISTYTNDINRTTT